MSKQPDFYHGIKYSLDDPKFYDRLFANLSKGSRFGKNQDKLKAICQDDYIDLSRRLEKAGIQESCSVRNILTTRRLAKIIINEKGDINQAIIPNLIKLIKDRLYSLAPNRQYDGKRQEQILKVLQMLQDNKEIVRLLKSISKPYSHKYAEQIIRDTLQVPLNQVVTDQHARQAALSALMCMLRQNVGSCFATAPAIIIHDEQPEMFLKDINDLLNTGRLKRTFGGVEYSFPLSQSWGVGDLRKQFFIDKELMQTPIEIWHSPSFMHALRTVNLLDISADYKGKVEYIKNLIKQVLSDQPAIASVVRTSVEEILQKILMLHNKITPQDLEDYQNRPRAMIQTSLMMHVPKASSGIGGKGEICAKYYRELNTAMNAFKSYADNALLKAWEFTIASFSESKATFSKWNLYSSLGLGPEEAGGIGQQLYDIIKRKLDIVNRKVQDHQSEYEQMYTQVKYLENRIRQASTEKEIQWLKVEYQMKTNEFYFLEEMRNKEHAKARVFADLFNMLIDIYMNKFPDYFQEVYDPDMHEVQIGPYDDSPAGFRLLYKHGRANTSQWTSINTPNEFVEALSAFFTATESEVVSDPRLDGFQTDISEIVTAIVNHVKTTEFLETAFYRMAVAHHTPIIKDPLNNLEKIEKKPWAYTSGGTMNNLVSCYYKREQNPTEVGRWVENEAELSVFLLETMKQIPFSITKEYQQNGNKSLLMHSPTHAFLFKPGLWPFSMGWETEKFTYTWLRDSFISPMKKFVENINLNDQMVRFLIDKLTALVPPNYQYHFKNVFQSMPGQISPKEFKHHLFQTIALDRGFRSPVGPILYEDSVDGFLFNQLPLFPGYQLKERAEQIFQKMESRFPQEFKKRLMKMTEEVLENYSIPQMVSAHILRLFCQAIIAMCAFSTATNLDFQWEIAVAAQQLGYAMPTPLVFADTNWVKDMFAFLVNPGTEQFELWRVDYTAGVGMPMSDWKQWLDGSRKDRTWGIYSRPYEYKF